MDAITKCLDVTTNEGIKEIEKLLCKLLYKLQNSKFTY